jgi:hypothetical protein
MELTAQVLNGEVKAGDTIAYATRGGSSLDMSIGTILDVFEKDHNWKSGVKVPVLRVKTTQSTDNYNLPRTVTVNVLDRVVKMS